MSKKEIYNLIFVEGERDHTDNDALKMYINKNKYNKKYNIIYSDNTIIVDHKYNPDLNKYNANLKNFKKSKTKTIMFIMVDIFQNLCESISDEDKVVYERLKELEKYIDIYPNVYFLYETGSKKYVLNKTILNYMLPGTYIYPRDSKEISKMKKGEYVIKYGLTSTSMGVRFMEGKNGSEIIKEIGDKNVKGSGANCSDNIAIVQPKSEMFDNCDELRFGIVGNKIIGFFPSKYLFRISDYSGVLDDRISKNEDGWEFLEELPKNIGDKNYLDYIKSSDELVRSHKIYSEKNNKLSNIYYKDSLYYYIIFKLNNSIYKFVKEVIKKINKIYPNNIYFRLDIIYRCNSRDDFVLDNEINEIYINEIEPYGSGNKETMDNIIDNEKCAFISTKRPVSSLFKEHVDDDYYGGYIEPTEPAEIIYHEHPCLIYDKLHTYMFSSIENDQLIKQILDNIDNVDDDILNKIIKLVI